MKLSNDCYRQLVLLLCICGCVGRIRCEDLDPSVAMEKYLKPSFKFAFSVFEKLNAKHQKGNVLMSIPALLDGLTMIYEGSDGLTKKILQESVQFPEHKSEMRPAVKSVRNKLLSSIGPKNIYKKGTCFFVGKNVTINDFYLGILKEYYPYSGIENLNFDLAEEAANLINAWVNNRSNGSIPTIVEKTDLSSDTQLVITSVEYFKGIWKKAFNPSFTRQSPFHVSASETVDVPIMYAKGKYQVKHLDEGITLIKLPYEDSKLSFLIALPDEGKAFGHLDELLMTSLTAFKGDEDHLQECEVFLPKFTVEESINLAPIFKEMGELGTLFSRPSNFSIMMENHPVSISSALQKTRVQVDETGSTAAAVQAMSFSWKMLDDNCRVSVSRPFYFVIQEEDIPYPLFLGRITRPRIEDSVTEVV